MRHFLDTRTLQVSELEQLLARAGQIKQAWQAGTFEPGFRGRLLINMFYESSTRTRVSFEVAAGRLGLQVVNFAATGSSVEKGETITDTFNTLAAMQPDVVVIRQNQAVPLDSLSHICPPDLHLINAGDGAQSHPSQALLDAFTIREHMGSIEGLRIVIAGDVSHSRVAASNIDVLTRLGAAEIRLCGPADLLPVTPPEPPVRYYHDLDAALEGVDIAMMLRIQHERLSDPAHIDLEGFRHNWQLNSRRLERAGHGCAVMHPGPMNRGVEISNSVADSAQSLITRQVANGVFMRMAIIATLLE